MSERGLNSADTSRPSARHAVALGLVLLVGVTVAGAALGGVTAGGSQSSPVEISDWTDLQAINDSQATLSDDYVLVNDLNKSTAGYNAVVLNQTATEFTENVFFSEGESRVNLTRTPVDKLLSNSAGLNLTVVDSANGTIERENTSSGSFPAVSYTTSTERFVGFSPIGPSFSEPVSGSFDGQGNTIRDLLIERPADDRVGLFGFSEGTIEQVTVANATITGSNQVGGLVGDNDGTVSNSSASGAVTGSNNVGGLVGNNFNGTVSTSSASGAVTGSGYSVGGLVGLNDEGTVSNSSASGNVTGFSGVGGLVGRNSEGAVSTSSASGAVTGSGDAGGLVGNNFNGTVSNSSASGAVDGSDEAGGLVGGNSEGTVSTSSASGAVNGSDAVGGLVGNNNDGTVSNSSASGNVTGDQTVGGLVGDNFEGTVSTSSASGAVNGSDNVGGLVGFNGGTVSTSSASGNVTGDQTVGGLVGDNYDGTVSNSSASGAVNGSSFVGGLVGFNGGTVSESFATGAVTGSSDMGGLVGQLGAGFLEPGEEAILRDSYYDTQTTGQQAAVGTIKEGDGTAELRGEVTGLPTSQMQGASAAQNMAALDFTSTWRVVTAPPGYPELRGLPDVPDPGPPSLPGQESPPQDPDGDGRFEDIDGDESFDIFDVQALFEGLNSDPVQNNPAAFNFNDDDNPEEEGVTIFDVQGLFELLD